MSLLTRPLATSLRKLRRLIFLFLIIIYGIVFSFLFLHNKKSKISSLTTNWFKACTRIFGIKIKVFGTPLSQKTLFISNHISWLDIPVIGQLAAVHFLSKSEVEKWPIIGWLASRSGTLYIKRGHKHSSKEAVKIMASTMKRGNNCLVFAEGKTTDGHVKKFHSRLVQSAIDAHAMVQPIAIFYPDTHSSTQHITLNENALFIGDTSFGESANLIMRTKNIDAEVHFLEPVSSAGKTRDELTQYCFEKVTEAITKITATKD